jgi:hypothetical protein
MEASRKAHEELDAAVPSDECNAAGGFSGHAQPVSVNPRQSFTLL